MTEMFRRVWGQDSPLRRWAIFETIVAGVVCTVMVAMHVSVTTLYLTGLGIAVAGGLGTSYFIQKDPRWSTRPPRDRDD